MEVKHEVSNKLYIQFRTNWRTTSISCKSRRKENGKLDNIRFIKDENQKVQVKDGIYDRQGMYFKELLDMCEWKS